jgi:CDP-glucose 4,6-dehydratase
MLKNYYKNKKIIITGHNGFKGSWLSSFLTLLGSKIYGISLKPEKNSHFSKLKLNNKISNFNFDIRNKNKILKTIVAIQPDIVFHLAAQALVRLSYVSPIDTWQTNVLGTLHMLEALRKLKKLCVAVLITSDKCYDNVEWVWGYRESEPMGGYDPYSNSKGCAELVTAAYRESFFAPSSYHIHRHAIASARAGNVIGGGDDILLDSTFSGNDFFGKPGYYKFVDIPSGIYYVNFQPNYSNFTQSPIVNQANQTNLNNLLF